MTAHLLISGFVQGIGYRQFVKKEAKALGLTGWVKNLPDRNVEALAIGEKEDLERLIKKCQRGPFLAKVKSIQVDWQNAKESFDQFNIVL